MNVKMKTIGDNGNSNPATEVLLQSETECIAEQKSAICTDLKNSVGTCNESLAVFPTPESSPYKENQDLLGQDAVSKLDVSSDVTSSHSDYSPSESKSAVSVNGNLPAAEFLNIQASSESTMSISLKSSSREFKSEADVTVSGAQPTSKTEVCLPPAKHNLPESKTVECSPEKCSKTEDSKSPSSIPSDSPAKRQIFSESTKRRSYHRICQIGAVTVRTRSLSRKKDSSPADSSIAAVLPDGVKSISDSQLKVEEQNTPEVKISPSKSQAGMSILAKSPSQPNPANKKGRAGRKKKKEPIQTTTITDYFPVRRSGRQTRTQIEKETENLVEKLIKCGCEDGLKVKEFEGKGRGIVATKLFDRGDFVVEYAGELVDIDSAKVREAKYAESTAVGCYMYFFNHKAKQYCVDATAESGRLGRLINHSRDGNCRTKVVMVDGQPRLILVAARLIQVGEELSYDYGDRSKASLEAHPWLKL